MLRRTLLAHPCASVAVPVGTCRCYHFGAVKALLETRLLPHIISGTSAGSVIGALVCTRTEDELRRDLRPEVLAPKMSIFASSWAQRVRRWHRHGTMFDRDDWYRRVRWFTCDDMTFEVSRNALRFGGSDLCSRMHFSPMAISSFAKEAYKKTGRVLCVTLSATSKKAPPVLINYLTAPNVVIASAVLASAAVPGFVDAVKLQVKDESGVVRDQSKCDEVSLRPMHVYHTCSACHSICHSYAEVLSSRARPSPRTEGISRWEH